MRVVFVHGACVRDGAWWWHRAGALLERRGIGSVAPALPSCGESGVPGGADGPGLADDVAAVRRVLTATDEPTVVLAHSYGGIVTAAAAADVPAVAHLVLVTSYLPEVGESLSTFAAGGPAPFLAVDADTGTFTARPETLTGTFLQDCPELTDQALARLAPRSLSVTTEPVTAAAWQGIPSTYVVCAQDRATPAEAQRRFAERAGAVVELPTGHHPFLSRTQAVADLVADLAGPTR